MICREDGIADPAAVTRRLVNDARKLGVELREFTDARQLDTDVLVVACGAASPELVDVPVRPLVRQLTDTRRVDGLPEDLPMIVEAESGFHFRRVDGGLRLAMGETKLRWGTDAQVDEVLVEDWLGRLAKRYPSAAGIAVARSWAGLYDMTPDAHPVIGWVRDGVYAACGFSGHGFMQAPAVGKAVAEELLDGESSFDLTPYRLERFSGDEIFRRPSSSSSRMRGRVGQLIHVEPALDRGLDVELLGDVGLFADELARGLADPGGRPRASPRHRPRPTDRSPRPTAKAGRSPSTCSNSSTDSSTR